MFSKASFYITVIFLHLIQVHVIYGFVFEQNKKHQKRMVDNPQLGKFYWLYNKAVVYDIAEKICSLNGQEIVQLPTQQEQKWVNEHLLDQPNCFWTGLKLFASENRQWKVMHGYIKNSMSRWNDPTLLSFAGDKTYARGSYLFGSKGSDSCKIVCQKEYSTKQAKFSLLSGKQSLGRPLQTIPADIPQCANACMATSKCTALAVIKQRKMCKFFDGSISNDSIDCSSEGITCFIQN